MIQIGSYTLKPAQNVISITSSAGTSSYQNAVGINYQTVVLRTSIEMTSSKVPIQGSYTHFISPYRFLDVPVTYVSESRNPSTGLYTQFIALQYPNVYQRAMFQDGVSIKLRSIDTIYFMTRSMVVSDYIKY